MSVDENLPILKKDAIKTSNIETQISLLSERIKEEANFNSKLGRLQSTKFMLGNYKDICLPHREYSAYCFKMASRHIRTAFEAFFDYQQIKKEFIKADPESTLEPIYLPAEQTFEAMINAWIWLYRCGYLDWELNNKLYECVDDGFKRGWDIRYVEDLKGEIEDLTTRFLSFSQYSKIVSPESIKKAEEKLEGLQNKEKLMEIEAKQRIELIKEQEWLEQFNELVKKLKRWPNVSELRDGLKGDFSKNTEIRKRLVKKGILESFEEGAGICHKLKTISLQEFLDNSRSEQKPILHSKARNLNTTETTGDENVG